VTARCSVCGHVARLPILQVSALGACILCPDQQIAIEECLQRRPPGRPWWAFWRRRVPMEVYLDALFEALPWRFTEVS